MITSFTAKAPTVECESEEAEAEVLLSWQIDHAKSVAVGSGDAQVDAIDAPLATALPGSLTDRAVPFSCASETVVYTLTAENADGVRVSAPLTITRTLAVETDSPEEQTPYYYNPTQPNTGTDPGAGTEPAPQPSTPTEPSTPPATEEPPPATEEPIPTDPPVIDPPNDTTTDTILP